MIDKILLFYCLSCEDNKKEKIYLRIWYVLNVENIMYIFIFCSVIYNVRRMIIIVWLVCKYIDRLY